MDDYDSLAFIKHELDCLQADYESLVILGLSDLAKREPETGYAVNHAEQAIISGYSYDFGGIRGTTWPYIDLAIRRDIRASKAQLDSTREKYKYYMANHKSASSKN